jgi:hypothetical protein
VSARKGKRAGWNKKKEIDEENVRIFRKRDDKVFQLFSSSPLIPTIKFI